MNKFLVFGAIVGSLFFSSCSSDDDIRVQNGGNMDSQEIITIRERNSNDPLILSNKDLPKEKKVLKSNDFTKQSSLQNEDYLGRSYDIISNGIGSTEGVRYPIIDIEKFILDNPDYYYSTQLKQSKANSFSFSNFERFASKSNHSSKISSNFSINLGVFSIGSKHKYERAFSSETINETNRVFGEVNVSIEDASYKLLVSSNSLKKIREKYLRPSFLDELYNTTNKEFIQNYGGLVITDYISGGRANAVFTGIHTENSNSQTSESSMDNSISASFSYESYGASADIGFGNTNGSVIASANNISDFKTSIITYGGNYGFSGFTIPKSIDDVNIDLSNWASSLNDSNNHVLIDFNDNGLYPITDFIREANLSYNLNRIINGNGLKVEAENLIEPRIEARWVLYQYGIGSIALVLKTRFNDDLVLKYSNFVGYWNNTQEMVSFAENESDDLLQFYNLEVVAVPYTPGIAYNPLSNPNLPIYSVHYNFEYRISDISESSMKKYYDSNNEILYLVSNTSEGKFAYSIQDDYILDTYGIRNWVDSMQTIQMSNKDLDNYTIVGL